MAQQGGPQEYHQVGLGAQAAAVLEQIADQRNVPEAGNLLLPVPERILDQSADHDDLPVLDQHGGFDRTLVGDQSGNIGTAVDARDLLKNLQADRAALRDLRFDPQGQADILALDGLKRRRRGGRRRHRVLPGDEWHILADHDLRFLVVERQQRRRRQDVRVAAAFKRA